jgi:hypothetical protein
VEKHYLSFFPIEMTTATSCQMKYQQKFNG